MPFAEPHIHNVVGMSAEAAQLSESCVLTLEFEERPVLGIQVSPYPPRMQIFGPPSSFKMFEHIALAINAACMVTA
jgi:hypothetical protein